MSGNVVKSAARVFEVLELFSALQRPLSVREISTRCGYPGSSAAALLTSMKALGYLAYDDVSHTYAPTARLVNLGEALVDSTAGSRRYWHAVAKRLAVRTREAVVIAVQSDLYVQYIDAVEGAHTLPIQFYAPIGTRREICMSSLGWALLSLQPDSAIRRLVSRSIRRLGKTGRTIDEDVVLDKVEQTRRFGYSYSANTVTQGAAMISMVIADGWNGLPLAMGVAGPVERIEAQRDAIVHAMREALAGQRPDAAAG
ncbi:helix-turn-helix domain-containing protein [Burkholderia sp. Ac-20384]|uniref:IclR family transcriptional regulator n=1 Tax=Burkholderia sp. Ac-20384 TaxID=2703902 RepID=UPI00197DF8B7|nr:helix-turn-helix domain-containing protein [Burkholderia sp. Ac-20384]MBN3827745.1 helix-turn-helix domain-containing protein [Burkholderia sp. Ac-20384]